MEKLNQIIEKMARDNFNHDTQGTKRTQFMLEHGRLGEFVQYMLSKNWHITYKDVKLGEMYGLTESFNCEVLWPRMKDTYIEKAVASLEEKVSQTYKVTIESI